LDVGGQKWFQNDDVGRASAGSGSLNIDDFLEIARACSNPNRVSEMAQMGVAG
jgi:hypothetical protein